MIRKYGFMLILIGICVLVITPGCNDEYAKLHDGVNPQSLLPVSENITAEVFYDASYSMYGYVTGENSYYIKMLQILSRAYYSGWPDGKIVYNKFGTQISQISRQEAMEASKKAFYFDKAFTQDTHIENVILKAKEKDLTIIVTDLFQKDADVNLLIEKLNEKFLSKNLAVGLLGIKSEFHGKVCDVGIQGLNFKYSTVGKKTKDYRPFFVLLLGSYNDVAHYYKKLCANGLELFPEKNFIIFSSHLVEQLASFKNSLLVDIAKLKEVTTILGPRVRNKHIKQFLIQGNPVKSYFISQVPLKLLPYGVGFEPTQFEIEVNAWLCSKNELIPNETAPNGLDIREPVVSGTQLNFRAEVSPANFPGNGTYCFEIILKPTFTAYSIPKWVSQWNMNLNDVGQWKQSPVTFKGATTLNLESFLNNIWQIIYQRYKPIIARMYIYIQKG